MNCVLCEAIENEEHEAVALVASNIYPDYSDADRFASYYPVCQLFVDALEVDNDSVIMLPGHHVLKFKNPVFKDGLNYTVRLGNKWYKRLSVGDFVEIADVGAVGRIVYIDTMVLGCLDEGDVALVNQHDPYCRTYLGLVDVIMDVYPKLLYEELGSTQVTVIGFWVYDLRR